MSDTAVTPSIANFDQFGLAPDILRALTEQGYTTPAPIQAEAIPVVLTGRDVLAAAQTGTGKTAGFSLPILQRLLPMASTSASPRATSDSPSAASPHSLRWTSTQTSHPRSGPPPPTARTPSPRPA